MIGKVGTDIEESKCSWLVVQALERADAKQKKVIKDNYGLADPKHVAKIKALYKEMDMAALFHKYEDDVHAELVKEIEKQKDVPKDVFLWMLNKIFKRQK